MLLSEALTKRIDILSEATEECELDCECSVCLELHERYIQLQALAEKRADDKEGEHSDILQGEVKKKKAKNVSKSYKKERRTPKSYTKTEIQKWLSIAEQHDVKEATFHYRVKAGWDIEKAATKPSQRIKVITKQKEVECMKEAKVKVHTPKDDLIQRAIKALDIDYVQALKKHAKESIDSDDFAKTIESVMILHQFKELEEEKRGQEA